MGGHMTHPNQGLMIVGIPARRLAPVVPAPPWCIAASICGKSLQIEHVRNSEQVFI